MTHPEYAPQSSHTSLYGHLDRLPLSEALDRLANDPIPAGRCATGLIIEAASAEEHAAALAQCHARGLRVIDQPAGIYPDCRPKRIEAYPAAGMIAMQHSEAVRP